MRKLAILLILAVLASCSTKRIPVNAKEGSIPNLLTVNTPFVKMKKTLFTGEFDFRNLSPNNSIIIYLTDIGCSWGKQLGLARNDRPFNIGEKTIDLKIGAVKKVKLRCDVNEPGSGEMSFTIKRIYENPNHDGKTAGKVLGENLVWSHKG